MAEADFLTTIFTFLSHARHNATPPTLADGEARELQLASDGSLKVSLSDVSTVTPHTWVDTGGHVSQLLIKATPGTLFEFSGTNEGDDKIWIMVFDAASLPVNGSTPTLQGGVEAGSTFAWEYANGRVFTTGIYAVASSTSSTLTYASSAEIFGNAEIL